jgi:hypothetical protein
MLASWIHKNAPTAKKRQNTLINNKKKQTIQQKNSKEYVEGINQWGNTKIALNLAR